MARNIPETISEKDFLKVVKTVKKKHIKLAFMLGFYQCLRVSEVVNLKPEHVDRGRGFIHIKQGKGNKDRDIPIARPLIRGLSGLPVGVGVRALQKQMKKYFPDYHFHTLRHSGATYYYNDKKMDIRRIQRFLGHSKLDTTMIYTHVNDSQLKDSFDEVWG